MLDAPRPRAAYDPATERNARHGDGDDDGSRSRSQRHGNGHRQDEVGKRLHEFHDPLTEEIEPPAEETTRQTPKCAERRSQQHGGHGDGQRRPAAMNDAAQHIPAQLVGAEPMSESGGGENPGLLSLIGIVGSDHVRTEGDEEHESDDHQPKARPTGL